MLANVKWCQLRSRAFLESLPPTREGAKTEKSISAVVATVEGLHQWHERCTLVGHHARHGSDPTPPHPCAHHRAGLWVAGLLPLHRQRGEARRPSNLPRSHLVVALAPAERSTPWRDRSLSKVGRRTSHRVPPSAASSTGARRGSCLAPLLVVDSIRSPYHRSRCRAFPRPWSVLSLRGAWSPRWTFDRASCRVRASIRPSSPSCSS